MTTPPKRACLPGPGPADPTTARVRMGSEGERELQGRVLEGLHPASLLRDVRASQTPLFIELSLLQGVLALCVCVVGGGVRRWRSLGVVSAKGMRVQRMPMGGPRGHHRPTRECACLRINRKRAHCSQFVEHFQAVLSLRSHGGGYHRHDSHFREKDLRFRWAGRGLGGKGPRSWV